RLNAVNVVDLDDYLKGVVPNEMPPSKFTAIEALKAQAVAARTYALSFRNRYAQDGYQICSTIQCQLYRGVESERPLSSEAVETTRGVVIKYQGQWIDAMYTSTCGGRTEDAANMFRSFDAPYLRGTVCPPENAREIDPRLEAVSGSHLSWTYHVSRADLEKNIQKSLPLDTLVDLKPLSEGPSGRVLKLKVIGLKNDYVLRGLEVKSVLGLKDSLFTMERQLDADGQLISFDFHGRGWGHGVGLCQTGAFGLALEGETFDQILKTYYSGVDIVREVIREN
ncbi:MAG: SpoIID/LytB domain-containing protein, partial [Acidobacteriia bacterium]|nr:SpoIID/LytB domain-containing protein [Terriglobia bacterium]